MKRKLYFDDLENFLAESADELRFYPSDRVWSNIEKKLPRQRRWPALYVSAMLMMGIAAVSLIFLKPEKQFFANRQVSSLNAGISHKSESSATAQESVTGQLVKPAKKQTLQSNPEPDFQGAPYIRVAFGESIENNTTSADAIASEVQGADSHPVADKEIEAAEAPTGIAGYAIGAQAETAVADEPVASWTEKFIPIVSPISSSNLPLEAATYNGEMALKTLSHTKSSGPSAFISSRGSEKSTVSKSSSSSRWSLQFYGAPSLSFRFLSEDGVFRAVNPNNIGSSSSINTYLASINKLVNHQPLAGAELGIGVSYQLTDKVAVRAGIQGNLRRYRINAYDAGGSTQAFITFDQGAGQDTLLASSQISSVNTGGEGLQITNQSWQLSAPIGLELQLAKVNRSSFVVGTTVQPTYNIGQQQWLLSSDFRNYLKHPDMLRRWNVNAGMEAIFRFQGKKGNFWQVGPQVRYQMLPSASKQYQVREHLIDYGIKFGFIQPLK